MEFLIFCKLYISERAALVTVYTYRKLDSYQ